jgi:hypothetical protein
MTTSVNRPTAKIYQFPVGGRASQTFGREPSLPTPATPVIYESAWYHAEAVSDADKTRPQ